MNDIARRRLLLASPACLLAPASGWSQQKPGVFRVASIVLGSPGTRPPGFEQGLQERGYVEGQNLVIDRHYAEMKMERLTQIVNAAVAAAPDVIVTGTSLATRVAMEATKTIPIVFTGVSDPLDTKLVTNLARPGANVTGFSYGFDAGFAAKWLQLLKQMAPALAHVAALHDYPARQDARMVKELLEAGRPLKLRIDAHYAADPAGLDASLAAIVASGARGLVVAASPFLSASTAKLIRFAAERRMPAMYSNESYVRAGGLMSYGPNTRDVGRRSAAHIDKILRGAKPGDLPVEQPTMYDLFVNQTTAQALGIKVPQPILLSVTGVVD